MAGGYNHSLAASHTARRKAATRSPVHFYLDVPVYVYELPCTLLSNIHEFRSRTPATNATQLWCALCGAFRKVNIDELPVNRPHSSDEYVAWEQDKGVCRERIAIDMSAHGIPDTEEEISELAAHWGVPVREIQGIAAGLNPSTIVPGEAPLCRKGKHLMVQGNISIHGGKPRCQECRNETQRAYRLVKQNEAETLAA